VGLGTSIFLIALGAILRFAVTAEVAGISLQTVGVILMVVGAIGLVLSLIFWSSWGFGSSSRRRTVVDRRDGTVVREDRYDDIDRAA
jgi:uncharacterized membrane protein